MPTAAAARSVFMGPRLRRLRRDLGLTQADMARDLDISAPYVALLERNRNPSELEVREAISGNLCRCTGYVNIVKAVQYAAERMG